MDELTFFSKSVEKNEELFTKLDNVLNNPFKRVSYTEGVEILLNSGKKWEFPRGMGLRPPERTRTLPGGAALQVPGHSLRLPRTLKPFYMKVNDDGKTVRAMDVLVPGVGEIIGGSQREERLDVLESRMKETRFEPEGYSCTSTFAATAPSRTALRSGVRAHDPVPQRDGEHPRRDPVPAYAWQRGVLIVGANRLCLE